MAISFKFVAGNTDIDTPLGILNQDEHDDLMVGTDCENPASLDEPFNWHFRVEGLTDPDVYPRRLDGPIETYGTWFNPSLTSGREDDKCDNDNHWPMHVVQSSGPNNTYIWDIYVVPYLGGSYIEGIQPLLPIPGTQYVLELAEGTSTYGTIFSDPIPPLFPIFSYGRDNKPKQDFYPAQFGFNYLDPTAQGAHSGVDIVPLGLFSNGEPPDDWDEDEGTEEYKKVFAVVGGTVLLQDVEGQSGLQDVIVYTTDQDPLYPNMQFKYVHVVPLVSNGSTVCAGRQIATIISGAEDTRANGVTHLHFEVARRVTSTDLVDPRQFIYPGLTPTES